MSTLVTVTGHDHPGVTAALMDVLTKHGTDVEDIEQVVVHGRLLLGLVFAGEGDGSDVFLDLRKAATDLGVEVAFEPLVDAEPEARVRHHVVVLGAPLPPAALAGVTRRLAAAGANIETITRLSSWPAQSFELVVTGGDTAELRRELAAEAVVQQVDVAVERGSIYRRAKRLVVLDVDSTLVQGEVIEMLAAEAGCEAEVARVTAAAMAGELDFEQSLRARVALLEGLPVEAVDRVRSLVQLTPGARTLVRTLKHLGWSVGIVSGGFTAVTDDLKDLLGLDHALANVLEVADGRLTGRVVGDVVDRAAKATALRRFAEEEGLRPEQTVAIGDGANDLDMLAAAGLGIAFNAKPVVRDAADAAISVPFLDAVLFLLGIPRDEVEQAT
jgi:phosphoserine phosphatase